MPDLARIKHTSLWWQEADDSPSAPTLLDIKSTAMGDFTLGGIPSTTAVFSVDENGMFKKLFDTDDAPGDSGSFDVLFRSWVDQRHELMRILVEEQKELYIQRLWYSCPPYLDRVLWKRLESWRIKATGASAGASRDLVGSDGSQDNTITISVQEYVDNYKLSISNVTMTEAQAINVIFGMSEDNDCLAGYPGRDKLIFLGAGASGAPANALYSVNGGGTFANFGTDPTPFTVNSAITHGLNFFVSETQIRVVYSRAADASTKVEWAYQDFLFSASTLTAASWNVITIAATSNNDATEAMFRHRETQRNYIAAAGDIYVNTDNMETDPGAAVYTGSNAFAAMTDHEGDVWAVAAADTILVERQDARGTFVARTGPNDGAFHSITFADDDTLFAGVGTKLYKSVNEAEDTTGWSSLKDFGASHNVVKIQCINGSSRILRVFVDDTTPGDGEIWHSYDGGLTFIQVTALTNQGYNDVYLFRNVDKALVAGDIVSSLGVIHLLS